MTTKATKAKNSAPAKAKKAKATSAKPKRAKAATPAKTSPRTTNDLPAPPDFSAKTHERYRSKLAALIELAEAGDVAGLKAFPINPYSSSPKAMDRYRNRCVEALEGQRMGKAA